MSSRALAATAATVIFANVALIAGCAAGPPPRIGIDKTMIAQFIQAAPKAGVQDQVTFLYYADLEAPRRFYGRVLGLSPYYETPWVTLYRSAPHATVGIVKRPGDQMTPDAKGDAVMLSIVTDDVASWYQRLKRGGEVAFEREIYDHPQVPIRAFLMRDPAGYSIEVFEWRKQ
jgi:hypothetical protein